MIHPASCFDEYNINQFKLQQRIRLMADVKSLDSKLQLWTIPQKVLLSGEVSRNTPDLAGFTHEMGGYRTEIRLLWMCQNPVLPYLWGMNLNK